MTRTDLCVNKPQSVPVIFEPPCVFVPLKTQLNTRVVHISTSYFSKIHLVLSSCLHLGIPVVCFLRLSNLNCAFISHFTHVCSTPLFGYAGLNMAASDADLQVMLLYFELQRVVSEKTFIIRIKYLLIDIISYIFISYCRRRP
jgi:hypothetical protein